VNGRRVVGQARIRSGDLIRIGDFEVRFIDTMHRLRERRSRQRLLWELAVILLMLLAGWEFDHIYRYLSARTHSGAIPAAAPSAGPRAR
jgi:pSer/pThr/pTyr-binding forkhead associated (FHA) protein